MKTIEELREDLEGLGTWGGDPSLPCQHKELLEGFLSILEDQQKEIQELQKVREIVINYIETQQKIRLIKDHLSAQQFNQQQSPQAPGGTYSTLP